MEVIARPRGKGKTQYILSKLREDTASGNLSTIMLVRNIQNRDAMRRQNPDLHNRIFTYSEERDFLGGFSRNSIWIDDIEEYLIQQWPGKNIYGFSISYQSDNGWDE